MAIALRRARQHHPEQETVASGGPLRNLMLGLNDGLVASFAVTSGVAGAFSTSRVVVMAGVAEMLGGAISMGMAGFISARSEAEFYQSEIERERDEIARWPERERDEVRAIYRQKGFAGALLDQIVAHITADVERWSNVMMREELGLHRERIEKPSHSGLLVGSSYLGGALIPVLPYVFLPPAIGIAVSALATVGALFAVGAAKTVITAGRWWKSGLESMATGIVAAAVTYGAGRVFASR